MLSELGGGVITSRDLDELTTEDGVVCKDGESGGGGSSSPEDKVCVGREAALAFTPLLTVVDDILVRWSNVVIGATEISPCMLDSSCT